MAAKNRLTVKTVALPAQRGEVTCSPVLAMRLGIRGLLHAVRKPFHSSPFKRREAGAARRTSGSAPAAEGLKPAASSASTIVSSRSTARDRNGGALALRRPPRSCAEGLTLQLGPGRASWNRRVQTGGPSPAPVQPAPGRPALGRPVDAQAARDKATILASGNRTRPISRRHRLTSLTWQADAAGNGGRGGCQ